MLLGESKKCRRECLIVGEVRTRHLLSVPEHVRPGVQEPVERRLLGRKVPAHDRALDRVADRREERPELPELLVGRWSPLE